MGDATGESVVSYEYSDYGETTINGNIDFYNEICYTGGIYDKSTELYYLNSRYYDPEDGVFLTQDTYRGEANDPSSHNLYAYCANNPVTYTDPSGHIAMAVPIVMFGIAIVSVTACAYTTSDVFQKSWQNAVKSIQNKYRGANSVVKKRWRSLCGEISKSFLKAKRTYRSHENHHIIARTATKAGPARRIYRDILKRNINGLLI